MSVKKFIIYSLNNCPYCDLTENLVGEQAIIIKVGDDTNFINKEQLKQNISSLTQEDVKTFPMIFSIDMRFIGGYNDLVHHLHKKELEELHNKS